MIKNLIFLFLLFVTISAKAQDKATLTKDETISYINRKVKEIDGLSYHYINTLGERLSKTCNAASFALKYDTNDKLLLKYNEAYPNTTLELRYLYEFKATYIKSIELMPPVVSSDQLGFLKIQLSNESALYSIRYDGGSRGEGNTSVIELPFLISDTSNFSKLKKALEHLQALYKSEDDPFGN
ncbi:hypothetical protein ACFQZS_14180 [Mucilaginibacter calamicampi]|uniref:DUF4468 domain-containing protein n=1 Tax=Mucilaginibacter calamicampi TaxID=1302352 RepID=A0ABW2YYJ7_9SPHI